ncbi:polymeric immunoglobulin receptor-like isoform X2 [Paramormyrops kingsleyae]|uniref:polymeric immunoglobulin receptor-like isoform X2 n=1 Tax=Paramormyrops kingsleyae TaxID=1676925 RepID=UPI003B971850
MAPLLFLLFVIFIGLPAILPVRSSKQTTLTGSAGGSISIPCFYGQEHRDSVKSWCKGKGTSSCSPETRSDSPLGINRVSVTDDPQNLVFIVTMRDLQKSDEGRYWCAVDDGWRHKAASDEKYNLITTDAQSVRTESWVSAPRGGSVTIPCYYDQNYKDKTKYLCRGYEWDSCSRIAQSDGEQSRGTVSVSDDRDQMVFNVTIRDLQEEDFDYYWCAVEASAAQSDGAFMPLIVREVIHVPTTQQTERNHHTTLRTTVSSPFPLTSNSAEQNVTNSILSDPTLPLSVGIVGVLLLMLLLLAVVMILCRRSAVAQARNRNRQNTAAFTPSVDPKDEVTYISVTTRARNLAHSSIRVMPIENMTSADPDVIYSNTTTQRKKAAANPHEVIYSTVARK